MTRLLESTVGKAFVFAVDIFCGLCAKAFYYLDGDDDA
jgi:hypothetical protein